MQTPPRKKADALIAFGANQGNRSDAWNKAVQTLTSDPRIVELNASQVVETQAVLGKEDSSQLGDHPSQLQDTADTGEENSYLNAAIRVLTTYSVHELHDAMIAIEKALGRERAERWGPRTVDLDLLLFNDMKLREENLIVPHPRMSFRKFVLLPALEIAGNMVHPQSGMTIEQLVDHIRSAPERMVIATNDVEFTESVSQDIPYDIKVVTDVSGFISASSGSKIVVSCFANPQDSDFETESLMRFARNFAGPTLEIDVSLGQPMARTELLAATEAMK